MTNWPPHAQSSQDKICNRIELMTDKLAIMPASESLQVRQLTGLIALISPELTNGTFGRLEETKWKVNFYLALSG